MYKLNVNNMTSTHDNCESALTEFERQRAQQLIITARLTIPQPYNVLFGASIDLYRMSVESYDELVEMLPMIEQGLVACKVINGVRYYQVTPLGLAVNDQIDASERDNLMSN